MKKYNIFVLLVLLSPFFLPQVFSQTFDELEKKYKEAKKDRNYEEAIEILDMMLKKFPDKEPDITYYNRGNMNRQIKKMSNAILDYTKVLEIKPNFEAALNSRGLCYFDLEKYNEAKSDFSTAINLKSDIPYYYFNRANVHSKLYDYDSAIADYTKAIELKPDFADAYYNRGNKYFDMSMFNEAIKDWEKVIEK